MENGCDRCGEPVSEANKKRKCCDECIKELEEIKRTYEGQLR